MSDEIAPCPSNQACCRCASCKKKLGLTGFTCRCGGLFCSIHRYSDKHTCDFDYKVGRKRGFLCLGIEETFGFNL